MASSPPEDKYHEEHRTTAIHAVFSFVIALVLLIVAVAVFITLKLTKPEPETKGDPSLVPVVEVQPIVPGSHRVQIETQGVVRSVQDVALAAEVGGRVMTRADAFIEGGTVRKGDLLVEIDPVNYEAALARAKSAMADARLALATEQALAEQAKIDWQRLGRGEPGELVLRKPQIDAAQARIELADAELKRATQDLLRTKIRAPFDARVRRALVEVGAVVAPGTPVGELYAADELEVRLPFPLMDFGFLDAAAKPPFEVTADVGGERKAWPAELVRVDGEVERTTLSGYGIAEVMADADGGLPPVGLFVEALVPGRQLDDVVVLPRSAVRGLNDVWVVEDGRLAKRHIEILRTTRDSLVVRGDFAAGDQLVVTRLAAPLAGMRVEIANGEVADER